MVNPVVVSYESGDPAPGPVLVLGVGGSGTRVIVEILEAMGVFMGADGRPPKECEWALWDEDLIDRVIRGASPADIQAIQERALEILFRFEKELPEGASGFGWKARRAQFVLPFLREVMPDLRLIHLWRDPRDMIFSSRIFGAVKRFRHLYELEYDSQEERKLRFWMEHNRRAVLGTLEAGAPVLHVGFENLCADPEFEVGRIAAFLGLPAEKAAEIVKPPDTIGRYIGRLEVPEAMVAQARAMIPDKALFIMGALGW